MVTRVHASIFLGTHTVHSIFLYNFQKLSEPSPHVFYLCIIYLSTNPTPTPNTKNEEGGTSLVVQWLRLCAANAGDVGSIPGRGTKIPHDTWPKDKNNNNNRGDNRCGIYGNSVVFS